MAIIHVGKEKHEFIVDDNMIEFLSKFRWNLKTCHNGKFIYAQTAIDGKRITMHRLLTGARAGFVVDHINGNTFDNRISNLRECSYSENALNKKPDSHWKGTERSTNLKGIRKIKRSFGFSYFVQGYDLTLKKRITIGSFRSEDEAIIAYNSYMQKQSPKFYRPNER